MKYLKRFSVLGFVVLIAVSIFISPPIMAHDAAEQGEEIKYTKEELIEAVRKSNISEEIKKIKCDFDKVEEFFHEYRNFFGRTWEEIRQKYKCEEVMEFAMERERKRWKFDLDIVTPEEGIQGGHLILYGHYIKPPYRVEVDYDKHQITINNVVLGSVNLPQVDAPKFEPSETMKIFNEIFRLRRKIRKAEQKLRPLYEQYLQLKIDEWKEKYPHEKVLGLLKEELEDLKIEHKIGDYRIYDEEKLLFALKFYYKWSYWASLIPVEYRVSKEKLEAMKKRYPTMTMTPEERKKYDEELRRDILKGGYENIIDDLRWDNWIEIHSVTPGTANSQLSSFKYILLALFSDANDYQKLIYMDEILLGGGGEFSKEILFNFNENEYYPLLIKLIKIGELEIEIEQVDHN